MVSDRAEAVKKLQDVVMVVIPRWGTEWAISLETKTLVDYQTYQSSMTASLFILLSNYYSNDKAMLSPVSIILLCREAITFLGPIHITHIPGPNTRFTFLGPGSSSFESYCLLVLFYVSGCRVFIAGCRLVMRFGRLFFHFIPCSLLVLFFVAGCHAVTRFGRLFVHSFSCS